MTLKELLDSVNPDWVMLSQEDRCYYKNIIDSWAESFECECSECDGYDIKCADYRKE